MCEVSRASLLQERGAELASEGVDHDSVPPASLNLSVLICEGLVTLTLSGVLRGSPMIYMLSIPCEREPVLIRAGPHSVGVGKNTFSRSVAAYFVPEITFIC